MKKLSEYEHIQMLKNLLFASIISVDNDEYRLSEEDKQTIIERYKNKNNWDYILEPIKDIDKRKKLIKFFEEAE